jgi:hypothetical protein
MISFSIPFVGLGLIANIMRNFFRVSQNELAVIIGNLFTILIATTSIFLTLTSVYVFFGGNTFGIPQRWVTVLPIISFFNVINAFNLSLLRNRKLPFHFGSMEVSKTTIDLAVTLLLVVCYHYGWEGRATGILVGTSAVGCFSLLLIYKSGYVKPNINYNRQNQPYTFTKRFVHPQKKQLQIVFEAALNNTLNNLK